MRGFDPTTTSYKYEVNQRFGSTSAAQTVSRTPVVLTMQLSVDLAPTRDWQYLRQQLDKGRSRGGARLSESELRQYSQTCFTNPMAMLLQNAEDLHLNRKQADSLATMSRRYTRLVDSLWPPSAKYLAAMPKTYDRTTAQEKLVAAREVVVSYLIQAAPSAKAMLTKGQLRVLPPYLSNMLEPRYLKPMKSGQTGSEFSYCYFCGGAHDAAWKYGPRTEAPGEPTAFASRHDDGVRRLAAVGNSGLHARGADTHHTATVAAYPRRGSDIADWSEHSRAPTEARAQFRHHSVDGRRSRATLAQW